MNNLLRHKDYYIKECAGSRECKNIGCNSRNKVIHGIQKRSGKISNKCRTCKHSTLKLNECSFTVIIVSLNDAWSGFKLWIRLNSHDTKCKKLEPRTPKESTYSFLTRKCNFLNNSVTAGTIRSTLFDFNNKQFYVAEYDQYFTENKRASKGVETLRRRVLLKYGVKTSTNWEIFSTKNDGIPHSIKDVVDYVELVKDNNVAIILVS